MVDVNYTITSDADDGHDDGSSWAVHLDPYGGSDDIQIQDTTSGPHFEPGFRFLNVNVPQGVTIDDAFLTLFANTSLSGMTSAQAFGDNVDNAPAWSNSSRPTSGFTNTTGGVVLTTLPGASTSFTIDVTACVQDIVDRAGWAALNAMRFKIVPNDTYFGGQIFDYDGGGGNEAQLDISYTGGGGGASGKPSNYYAQQ